MKKENNIAERVYFRIEYKIYQECKMFHLNFLEKTKFFAVSDIKDFFILLIEEWTQRLQDEKRLKKANSEIITYINRKGKRVSKMPYEGETTRITFHFKPHIVDKWNDIVYTLMNEDNFEKMKDYSNGYFLPNLFDFAKENIEYLIDKYQKYELDSLLLKLQEKVTIRFFSKSTIKNIEGKVISIENTPNGLVIHIDRVNI